jgi:hypothetical protein
MPVLSSFHGHREPAEGSGSRAHQTRRLLATAATESRKVSGLPCFDCCDRSGSFGDALGLVIALNFAGTRLSFPPRKFGREQGLPFCVSEESCFQRIPDFNQSICVDSKLFSHASVRWSENGGRLLRAKKSAVCSPVATILPEIPAPGEEWP